MVHACKLKRCLNVKKHIANEKIKKLSQLLISVYVRAHTHTVSMIAACPQKARWAERRCTCEMGVPVSTLNSRNDRRGLAARTSANNCGIIYI